MGFGDFDDYGMSYFPGKEVSSDEESLYYEYCYDHLDSEDEDCGLFFEDEIDSDADEWEVKAKLQAEAKEKKKTSKLAGETI